jgi:hypothetical protein
MGELIAFKQPVKQPAKQPNMSSSRISKNGQTAQILFFTGVRYVSAQEQEILLKQVSRRSRRQSADRLPRQQPPR